MKGRMNEKKRKGSVWRQFTLLHAYQTIQKNVVHVVSYRLVAELQPTSSSHISCTVMLVMHYVLSAVSEVGQCTSTQYTRKRWNEHTSPHTMVARLGSAPLFSRVSTTSVCVSVCLCVSPHAILAVRAITSKTKDTIVLSVEFEAIVKWQFS